MKPTDQLSDDHRTIETVLTILERMCATLETGSAVQAAHVEQVLEFLKLFADRYHHGKEENLLFPAMEKVGFSKDQGPLAVMLSDHTAGRNHIRELSAAIAEYKKTGNSSGILRPARNYITLLREHIQKEDMVLFPMAAATIGEPRLNEMSGEFAQLEREMLGNGKREEFQDMIKTLKNLYHA